MRGPAGSPPVAQATRPNKERCQTGILMNLDLLSVPRSTNDARWSSNLRATEADCAAFGKKVEGKGSFSQ
jgi:hypothetical protein